jgi:hypothetical protein
MCYLWIYLVTQVTEYTLRPNYYILTFLNTKTFDMDLYIWMSRYVANAMYIVRVLYRRIVNLYRSCV